MRFSDTTQGHIPQPIKYANRNSSPFNSPIKPIHNSPFKQIVNTPRTDIPFDSSRHLSQNQSNLHPPPIDRTTKTHYPLRRQPQMDYRLFIPPSKLYK